MKLPVSLNTGALALGLALMAGGLMAVPAEGRERTALPAETSGPAGDYPVVVGEPFVVDGVTYTPADRLNYDAVGKAVQLRAGEATALISGAHRTLPIPSYVEVTALDSGRTALVRLDQRGPMSGDALVALSPMAWAQLGLPVGSAAPVRVRRVNPPEQERALLRTGQAATLRMDTPPGLLAALRRKLGVEPPVSDLPVTIKPADVATVVPKPAVPRKPALPAKPAPKPMPALDYTPPARTSVEPPPARPAAASDRYYVQIGAFAQRGNADAAARKAGGTLVRAGNLWRVRSGPFSTGTEAQGALAKARAAGYAGARTVRE
jgi:rare lipoprotein A